MTAASSSSPGTDIAQSRYHRQLLLDGIGDRGQRLLGEASVLVVGAGGLGVPAATYLAAAGTGRIGLCDGDTVGITNLNRQVLYTEADLGRPKTECAVRRLGKLSPATVFESYPVRLCAENAGEIIGRYDLVLDCCDNFATRYLLDEVCTRLGKPWVYGAIGGYTGQIALMNGAKRRRYTDLFPEIPQPSATPRDPEPVIGFVPGVTGTLQAAEAIKHITGCADTLDGRLFYIDLRTMQSGIIDF